MTDREWKDEMTHVQIELALNARINTYDWPIDLKMQWEDRHEALLRRQEELITLGVARLRAADELSA